MVDSQPMPPTNSACTSQKASNKPACTKPPLGDCTNTKYNAKSAKEKFTINHKLYMHDVRVAFVPHDINGNIKYVIKCNEMDWHSKQKDGHHWVTTCGKNMKLNGLCRVSKCKGSLECTNKNYPHYLREKGTNKKAFECSAGEYTCKNCGLIASRQWCSAKKAVEYDRTTKTLTVWHQGMHRCTLKNRDQSKEEKRKRKKC